MREAKFNVISADRHTPANPEELPGKTRSLLHSALDVLAVGKLRVLAESLEDDVAEASVSIDSRFVGFVDRVGHLRAVPVLGHLSFELLARKRFQACDSIPVR